jgi:hypothetical protein
MPVSRPISPLAVVALLFVLLAVAGGVAPLQAAEVRGLYEAEVPVAGQGTEQRNDAIVEAFARMLVKVTGNREIALHPVLAGDLAKAPRYVQQYRYRIDPNPPLTGQTEAETDAGAEPPRLLSVTFDSQAVNSLLRDRRLPVWGGNRPAGLTWIGIETGGNRRLMFPEGDESLRTAMEQTAQERGLPLLFPLMDLEDRAGLSAADLWGDFEQNLRRASERYSPDLLLTVRLVQVAETLWRGTWRLYQGDQTTGWDLEGGSAEELAQAGLDQAVDILAERFAPVAVSGALSQVRIRVAGITGLERYLDVTRFLGSQSSVDEVKVVYAEPDAVTFSLGVRGGILVLQQGLELSGLIEPVADASAVDAQMADEVDLHYRVR